MAKHLPTPYWSYGETILRLKRIKDPYRQHLCTSYYATGARLNELMPVKPTQIQLDAIKEGLLWVQIYTLKQSNMGTRAIPLTMSEPFLFHTVQLFAQSKNNNYREFQNGICDRTIENHVRKELGIKVHHLRHLRAHHLGKTKVPNQKQLTARELQYYFGWKNLETAQHYLEDATPQEVADKF